jgi:hypothetical protein
MLSSERWITAWIPVRILLSSIICTPHLESLLLHQSSIPNMIQPTLTRQSRIHMRCADELPIPRSLCICFAPRLPHTLPDQDVPPVTPAFRIGAQMAIIHEGTPLFPAEMHDLVSGFSLFYQILPLNLVLPLLLLANGTTCSTASAFYPIRLSNLLRIQISRSGASIFKSLLLCQ